MKQISLFLFLGLILFSCTKEELVTVSGNIAPNDTTVELAKIENYITRTYILSIGREPDSSEFAWAKANLVDNQLSPASRQTFLSAVFSNPDYLPHEYDLNKTNLLNAVDTSEFTGWIFIFDNALPGHNQSGFLANHTIRKRPNGFITRRLLRICRRNHFYC
ncbi:MAG: hypothetical protein IPP51_01475 [Bacteroidetes bacterium]|nr:hypothetical protein [Bacteroidota bacterium]